MKSMVWTLVAGSLLTGATAMTSSSTGNTYHIRMRPTSIMDWAANRCGTTQSSNTASRYAITARLSRRAQRVRNASTRPPTSPNTPVSQKATTHQFSQNIAIAAARMMNTKALRPTSRSPRHNGCQIRNKPRCARNSGCTHGLSTPSSSAPCNDTSIASNSQRPVCKRSTLLSVSIPSSFRQHLVKTTRSSCTLSLSNLPRSLL